MKKIQSISASEKQVMEILWTAKEPLTTAEIIKKLPKENTWKQNTVITFLSRLTEKGIISATRIGRANHYEPCITQEEYLYFETREFIDNIYGGSVYGFINTLFDSGDLTKDDIEHILEQLKEEE